METKKLKGFFFTDENNVAHFVIAATDDWCMVEREDRKKPVVLATEFVQNIYNDRRGYKLTL